MGLSAIAVVVAIASLSPTVAADAGDDFSNNLFSDLAPYAVHAIKIRSSMMLTASIQALGAFRRAVCEAIHEPVKLLAQGFHS